MQLQGKTQDGLAIEIADPEAVAGPGSPHGIWIALATFVPTFCAIFFGIPYLAGPPMAGRFPAGVYGTLAPVVPSPAPQQDLVDAPAPEPASVGSTTSMPSGPTRETPAPAAVRATTPTISSPSSRSPHPRVEGKASEPRRSASTVTKHRAWVRGAAFSDRDSAERLATSIERQGYEAKVRRENARTTPWVVWISKQPRGMTPARRHK